MLVEDEGAMERGRNRGKDARGGHKHATGEGIKSEQANNRASGQAKSGKRALGVGGGEKKVEAKEDRRPSSVDSSPYTHEHASYAGMGGTNAKRRRR